MKYNPESPLSEDEVKNLSEDDFFEYLDSKAAYLKAKTMPLNRYVAKMYASMEQKGNINDQSLKEARKVGKQGEDIARAKIKNIKKPNLNVEKRKTNRSQWV